MKIGNLEVYGIIYKITNIVNDKVYIGQTTNEKGFKGRYNYASCDSLIGKVYYTYLPKEKYKEKSIYNKHLLYSIRKYGFDAFKVIEIFDIAFSKKELDIKEDIWIDYFDCINNGYNNMGGGSNGKLSKKSRLKLSKTWKEKYKNGYIPHNLGNKHTDDWKEKMSKVHSGENNAMFGISPQERMDENTFNKWRNNISKSVTRGKNPFASKVVCLETKKVYECVKDAEEENNITGISAVCRKIRYSCGGMHWAYYEEYLNMTKEDIEQIYIKEKESKISKNTKSLICTTTNKLFKSIKEARAFYNCDSHICDCCNNKRKYCGRLEDGTKLEWKYISDLTPEEYIKYDIENKLNELHNHKLVQAS
ncbi:NUMOD3 domain-containing DNA-binding protein [Clostridium beijerinckii]|uniref:NUMOD3 domain-containing DNA-binding protein n=1 Tax=Clostridium beijerinckii TaxID=1520 RepID=UPI0015709E85|nr:NUMOD3 domain-containing DNA-binding protein [Clostridium beijerinckii]NRU52536.1 hypothetical protein [Clostridium beijerinckii]NYC69287.1 hypothetical protein [Clostridium beijerinckii]NYC91737.1 hypothetical protein [Clostridium beijerinckii]